MFVGLKCILILINLINLIFPLNIRVKKIIENCRNLVEDSLVLVQVENGLWCSGRVTAVDDENLAVKLLSTGREVATLRSKVLPLPEFSKDSSLGNSFFNFS